MSLIDLNDEELAEKFHHDYPEQFNILVRMHLSFILDQNTEEHECTNGKTKLKKWKLVNFSKKSKAGSSTDGDNLTHDILIQISQLIDFIKTEENLKIEGIFRRTGSLNRQNELKNLLSQDVQIDFSSGVYSVHDCASVLKTLLSELPDPLLTECHFPAYCQIADQCENEEKLLDALQLIILLLPKANTNLLQAILNLLNSTALHEDTNKMSPENLATLFTPHLLCPRKLTAEQFHSISQNLHGIVAFLIRNSNKIFKIPQKLILDLRVRYEKLMNKMNESTNDAASTVYTFLDRERTAKENEENVTETALAQLYAYIQALPESTKKKKLVKQFNKENGHGTPLQVIRSSVPKKSFGNSIKKHILTKRIRGKFIKSSSEEILNTPTPPSQQNILTRARLFCTNNCDKEDSFEKNEENVEISNSFELQRSYSEPNLQEQHGINYLTSTPACCLTNNSVFTPEKSDDMSPISRSTQRMTRAMQETMMTPRSRKPVLLLCEKNMKMNTSIDKDESLTNEFKDYLNSRDMNTDTLQDLSFSSRTDDFASDSEVLTQSLLRCLNGKDPDCDESSEKELVLKPKKFDENGQPIVFETSF